MKNRRNVSPTQMSFKAQTSPAADHGASEARSAAGEPAPTLKSFRHRKFRMRDGHVHFRFALPQVVFAAVGLVLIGGVLVYRARPQTSLADLAPELQNLATQSMESDPLAAASISSVPPEGEEVVANEETLKARLQFFANEFSRLKKYEAQLQKRADSLDTLLAEIESLENGSVDSWGSGESSGKARYSTKSSREGLGGGSGPQAPVIHQQGTAAQKTAPKPTGEKVSLLLNELDQQILKLSYMPVGSPIASSITSGFGWRYSPFNGRGHRHQGADFSVDRLSSVVATADGMVINAGPKGDYGNAVVIKHRNGFETLYAHLAKVDVKPGEKICRGEQVGLVGTTGRSTGPHLHYEVRVDGNPRNPEPFIEVASFARLLKSES